MTTKPQLSVWQIWNMCFGFLGIQFGFALQNANVSRIFQTLGAEIDDIPILWIAAPLTGLLVQPIVGYFSDRTWNRFGRRRPYFLAGAILTTLALFVMPNSPTLWIAAGALWIMDASINITMEPFRAFVGDNLPNEQRTTGFAMQSFFIGVGAVVASALPWMMTNWFDISNTAPAGEIADSVRYAFYFGGAVLFLAVMWTVISSKEYSPEQLEAFEAAQAKSAEASALRATLRSVSQYLRGGTFWLVAGLITTVLVYSQSLDKELYILTLGAVAFGLMQFITAAMQNKQSTDNGFYAIMDDLFHMPGTMKQLAVVQFFSWFALFAMWIYMTPAVTSYHYGSDDVLSKAYAEGADWAGVLGSFYNGFAALAAFAIPLLARLTNRRVAHMINLTFGGLGLMSFIWIKDPAMLWIATVGIGIAWASILSVPYSILANSLPNNKMGVYMGIFNFFIVIPQLMAASILGLLVRELFAGDPIYALVLGGISMILAGIATLFVKEDQGDTERADSQAATPSGSAH